MTDQSGRHMGRYADSANRYRLDSIIATGGMGVVWRGTDTRLNRPVAIKVLKEEYADDPLFRTRFESEARSAAALHHPGIAGMYDYGTGDGDHRPPYLVMELVEGQPLSTLLANAKANGRVIDVRVVQDLMAQAAEALAVAHRAGIVHRDVKPANLLVTADRRIKITDFGIARAADSVALTRTGSVMGTPQYLSPEQARGNPSTPASDVYSLGVVAFECLAGRRPFEAETPVATALAHLQQPVPALPDSVPADLAAVVTTALAKDPRDRYSDGAAFGAALRAPGSPAAAETGTQVMPAAPVPVPTSHMERLDQPSAFEGDEETDEDKKSPWPIIIAVILLVTAAVIVAALLLGGGDEEDPDAVDSTVPTITESSTQTTPTEETTPTTTAPATVQLDESAYTCDEDYSVVGDELQRELDLQVSFSRESQQNDGSCPENSVSRIDPSGTLNAGDRVTVYYWGPVPEPTTEPTSEATTPTTAPTTVATTPTDVVSRPAEGEDE